MLYQIDKKAKLCKPRDYIYGPMFGDKYDFEYIKSLVYNDKIEEAPDDFLESRSQYYLFYSKNVPIQTTLETRDGDAEGVIISDNLLDIISKLNFKVDAKKLEVFYKDSLLQGNLNFISEVPQYVIPGYSSEFFMNNTKNISGEVIFVNPRNSEFTLSVDSIENVIDKIRSTPFIKIAGYKNVVFCGQRLMEVLSSYQDILIMKDNKLDNETISIFD